MEVKVKKFNNNLKIRTKLIKYYPPLVILLIGETLEGKAHIVCSYTPSKIEEIEFKDLNTTIRDQI